jgi:putative transposase
MPNHVHFIINFRPLVGADLCVRPYSLAKVVQWFKTMTSNEYMRKVKEKSWKFFSGKLWQRNYWERIIRGEKELYFIRE